MPVTHLTGGSHRQSRPVTVVIKSSIKSMPPFRRGASAPHLTPRNIETPSASSLLQIQQPLQAPCPDELSQKQSACSLAEAPKATVTCSDIRTSSPCHCQAWVQHRREGKLGGMSDPTMQRSRGNGGGGMRTVECLRGRLLAERVASKAAKEEADMLASRLDELEKKLSDEVKIRNKAERRLRRAINKLESLKILDVELSGSSIGSMSSYGCSGHQAPEMEERNDAGSLSNVDSVRSGPRGGEAKGWDGGDGDSAAGSSAGSCTQVNSSQDGSWFSVMSEQSGSGSGKGENRMDPDDAKNRGSPAGAGDVDHDSEREQQPAASNGSSKSEASYRDDDDDRLALVLVDDPHHDAEAGNPTTEHDARAAELHAAAETNEEEEEESNRLAIVLVDPQPRPDAKADMRGSSNDVQSVLLALRQVKEQLRYTIERRSEGLVAHRELYGH